jgi:hypothetical protein
MIVTETDFVKKWKSIEVKPQITLGGFKGDSITVEQIKTIKKVILTEGFQFVSGTVIIIPESKEGLIVELIAFSLNDEDFEKKILKLVKETPAGDLFTIRDIKVKNKERKIVEMPDVYYKIIK